MLVNTITSPTPVSPTRTTPPFYPMLDASPSSPTPSLLSSHTSPITNNELAYIPPTQPSWPHTSLPRSSLWSYTHSREAPPRCPFIVNNNTNANVAAPAAADPQKTAVVGDNAHSCSAAPLHPQTHTPSPSTSTPTSFRLPPPLSPQQGALVGCWWEYRTQHTERNR